MAFLTEDFLPYRDSYLEALREFQAEGRNTALNYEQTAAAFESFMRSLHDKQRHPEPGRVAESVYWLVDQGEFIGRLSLRHQLNEMLMQIGGHIGYEIRPSKRRMGYGKEILRLGLEKARAAGLTRVLVTCDDDNIGSYKIIEANGGKLENKIQQAGRTVLKRRYWIDLG